MWTTPGLSMAASSHTKEVGKYLVDADIDHPLGETPNCIVFKGEHVPSGRKVAAKMVKWLKGVPTDMIDDEANLMKNLPPHDNVVKLYDYIKKDVGEKLQLWLMLEKCQQGDLEKFAQSTSLDLKQKLDLFLQSAIGLNHIHKQRLVHRDIKLKNILVHGSSDNPIVKIADFGISRIIERDTTEMTTLGTDSFKAPELYKEGKPRAGQAVDVFSLAVTFLTILDPVDGPKVKPFRVKDVPLGKYLLKYPNTNVAALINKSSDSAELRRIKNVLAAMLAPTAGARPSMEEVVDQLTQIHRALCVKVFLCVNTAWKPRVLLADKDNLTEFQASMNQESEPETDGATAAPYVSVTNMGCVDKVTTEKVVGLLLGSDNEENDVLVAVETWDTKAMWIHTPEGWEKKSDVPAGCQMFGAGFCNVPGGFVLLGGFDSNYENSSQCWFFSFSSHQWEKMQDMSIARYGVSATVVGNTLVAVGGRGSKSKNLNLCEKMDLATKTWSSAAPMPHAMYVALIAAAAGHVYIKDRWACSFFCYDPNTDAHTKIPVPDIVPEKIGAHCMISNGNSLYILGGSKGVAIQYNLHTGSWLKLTPPRAIYDDDGCCAVVRSDKVLLFGGSTWEGWERDIIEEYDVQGDAWRQLDTRLPFKFYEDHCRVFKCSK